MARTSRQWLGVTLRDLPRYVPALALGGDAHLRIANRGERLERAPEASGYRCDWKWTSNLHAPSVMPLLGRALMRRALGAHPIVQQATVPPAPRSAPQVSFIVGHRGDARLPHLLATIQTIAAQAGVAIECIVVEQAEHATLADRLPTWVRHVHSPCAPAMPYCRSSALNTGAAHALSPVLVLHDGDMLVPRDYAASILDRFQRGYEVANLKRFVFYLGASHTQAIFAGRATFCDSAPQDIVQNLEAGGSVAITRTAFDAIGGMDESFVGWGGEDNEFWERAQTRKVWPWANLPMVHLWHESQPGKQDQTSAASQRYRELAAVEPRKRIERLRAARGL